MASAPRAPRPARPHSPCLVQQGFDAAKTGSQLPALVPRPRLHLIRFGARVTSLREVRGPPLREHGVLAPNAKLRALVVPQEAPQEVPQGPEPAAQAAQPAECKANCAHHRPVRLSWAKLLKRVLDTTSLEYKLVLAEASLSSSTRSTARTAAAS